MAAVGKRQVGCLTSADRGQIVTVEMCISSSGQFILQLSYSSMCAYEPEFLDRAPTGSVGYTHHGPAGCKCQSLHVLTGFVISYCMRIHQKNIQSCLFWLATKPYCQYRCNIDVI